MFFQSSLVTFESVHRIAFHEYSNQTCLNNLIPNNNRVNLVVEEGSISVTQRPQFLGRFVIAK